MRSSTGRPRELVLLGAGLVLLGAYVFQNMDLLADSFWYVATGRFVLDGKGFPAVDPFAFSAVKSRWIVHMPASVVLFAWLDRHAGLSSLIVVSALVETCALGTLWLRAARSFAGRVAVFPLVLFAVYLQRDDLCARGQVFGDLAFVATLVLVRRLRKGQAVSFVVAPILGALWVNFHSSFALGVIVPAIAAVSLLFEPRNERGPLPSLLIFGATLGLGTLLNPYGWGLVRDVFALATHPTTLRQQLFMPPDFGRVDTLVAFGLGACALGARREGKVVLAPADMLLVVLLATAAASGVRYLPYVVYVSIFSLAPAFDSYATEIVKRYQRRSDLAIFPAAALALAATLFALRGPKDPFAHVPIAAANFVKAHPPDGNVLNDYHSGGFLLYVWEGHPKVFIDGRSYLYFNGVFEDAETLARVAPGYEALLDAYDAKTAVLEKGSPLAVALVERQRWKPIFEDRLAVVLERPSAAPIAPSQKGLP